MVIQVTATEAKARLLQLLDDVEAGDAIEITRHGKTVARLVPAKGPSALKDLMAGRAWTVDPNDDLLGTGEIWEASDDDRS